jgi:lysozyme family protein
MHPVVQRIIFKIIEIEGDAYTNDPNDSGGPTKYGITHETLARFRKVPSVTAAQVAALTEAEAIACYEWLYVLEPEFNLLLEVSEVIAHEVIDTGVNCGQGTAATFLQRCLNIFNNQQKLYADLKVDGDCGPATVRALKAYVAARGALGITILNRALNCLQGSHYVTLSERREKDEKFTFGWFANRIEVK